MHIVIKHKEKFDDCLVLIPLIVYMQDMDFYAINRLSYMSAHVLLNLLNKLRKRDKMLGLRSILLFFRNKFDKFNNTRA